MCERVEGTYLGGEESPVRILFTFNPRLGLDTGPCVKCGAWTRVADGSGGHLIIVMS